MQLPTDLKSIERKTWQVWFEDGLIDIMWSLVFLNFIPAYYLKLAGLPLPYNYFPVVLLGLPIVFFGKLFITRPRLGNVKFSLARRRRAGLAKLVSVGISLTGFALLAALTTKSLTMSSYDWFGPESGTFILLAVTVILPMSILSWLIENWRFAVYGTLLVIGDVIAESLLPHIGHVAAAFWGFTITGTVILIFGVTLLVRFLKRFPVLREDDLHA